MAGLVDSICTIIAVFQKYADRNRDCSSMKRRQMRRLLQNEFGEILENPRDPQIVKLTFQLLDLNGDNLVDFNEFLFLIFEVATACYSVLHPRECLSYKEERSRAVRNEEPRRNGSSRREFREDDRRGEDVHERRGADRTPLQSVEEARGGELSRELQGEEEDRHFERRDRELRDDDRRDRSSQEHLERVPERRHPEPTRQEDIETPKPHQLKQREEDSLRQSQELVRRNDIDRREARDPLDGDEEDLYSPIVTSRREDRRQRQGRETERQDAEGRRFRYGSQAPVDPRNHRAEYDVERSRPSHERREREDGRRDLEMHNERRSRALEPHGADERRDRIRHRSPVDDSVERRSLSREGERRSQSHEADHREGERRRRQERYVPQSREDVLRAIRAEEEEVRRSERRRVEDEWSRPRPREASRRPEVEGLEHRERESRRPYSSELENMDRPSRSRESEGREEVRRSQRPEDDEQEFSQEETPITESGRRRPQSQEPEARDPKYERSQRYEEPRRDDQRRPRDYEVHSPEREVERRRRLQPRELVDREDNQERQYYEREVRDGERERRHAMSLELETRDEDRRRLPESASRYGERERLPEGDARRRRSGRDVESPSDARRRELDPNSPQQSSRPRAAELRRSEPRSFKPARKD